MANFWLIDAAAIVWLTLRNGPQRFGDHLFRIVLFRREWCEIRFPQDTSFEAMERNLWKRVFAHCAAVLVIAWTLIEAMSPFPLWAASVLATVTALISFVVIVRCSRTYRHITLPMYLTLCRMEGARWDPRGRATRWVRVSPKGGKVWIRLPKDWHASRIQIRQITMLVNSRLTGRWNVSEDTPRFLLTFTREPEAVTIELHNIEMRESIIADEMPDPIEDAHDFDPEGDGNDKPW